MADLGEEVRVTASVAATPTASNLEHPGQA